MSDETSSAPATPARATTAGGLLRQARQAQGLHIAAHLFTSEAGDYYTIDPNTPSSAVGEHHVVLPE